MESISEVSVRLQNIPGTVNFRDIGGYRAAGGTGTTKWHTLYRSDALNKLSAAGLSELNRLSIANVIDLRDDLESSQFPNVLPAEIILTPHPIFPSALNHIDRKLTIDSLTELIFFEHADSVTKAVELISQKEGTTVVHCTAGKDRTGAVIAATLSAIGVDRDDILNDYELSEKNLAGVWVEEHLKNLRKAKMDITPEVLGLISTSPLPALDRALKMIDHEYGSMVDYLINNGLTPSRIAELHNKLVV